MLPGAASDMRPGCGVSSRPEVEVMVDCDGTLTDVTGLRVGHFTNPAGATGCTVVLCEAGATAAVDVRGAAPATRQTDLLRPENTVQQVQAVLLTGGSAFGLAAAAGVMRYLEEIGAGFPTSAGPVPIVPAAALFDLGIGQAESRPSPDWAAPAAACAAARRSPRSSRSTPSATWLSPAPAAFWPTFASTRAASSTLRPTSRSWPARDLASASRRPWRSSPPTPRWIDLPCFGSPGWPTTDWPAQSG